MAMMETELGLKPCPFCGENRVSLKTITQLKRENQYTIVCWSCAAEGGWSKTASGARKELEHAY